MARSDATPLAPNPVQQLRAGVNGMRMRHVQPEEAGDLDDRARQAVDLEGLAGLEILEHRGLVISHGDARLESSLE